MALTHFCIRKFYCVNVENFHRKNPTEIAGQLLFLFIYLFVFFWGGDIQIQLFDELTAAKQKQTIKVPPATLALHLRLLLTWKQPSKLGITLLIGQNLGLEYILVEPPFLYLIYPKAIFRFMLPNLQTCLEKHVSFSVVKDRVKQMRLNTATNKKILNS